MNVGMVFSMILAIIVIVMVLTLGSEQIANIFSLNNAAITQRAVNDLKAKVLEAYDLTEGSTIKLELAIPGNTRLCFVDPENPEDNIDPDQKRRWKPDSLVKNIITENGYNLWIESPSEKNGDRVEYLRTGENFCAGTGTALYLTNSGLTVSITD